MRRGRFFLVVICAILVLLSATGRLAAKTMTINLDYSKEDLAVSKRGRPTDPPGFEEFDVIRLKVDKEFQEGDPGQPLLPFCMVHVLLPERHVVDVIHAEVLDEVKLDGTYDIYPAQPPYPSSETKPPAFVEQDPVTYSSSTALPEEAAVYQGSGIMRGHSIGMIRICPVAFIPATGEMILRKKIELTIETRPAAGTSFLKYKRSDALFKGMLKRSVINPAAVDTLYVKNGDSLVQSSNQVSDITRMDAFSGIPTPTPPQPGEVKYLLITHQALVEAFQPLVDWKIKKGIPAEIVTTDYIDEYYSSDGEDLPERMKACIRDYAENKGTIYVVLAGDETDSAVRVPSKGCYIFAYEPYIYEDNPTDYYFACLDDKDGVPNNWKWDENNNEIFGEDGDDVDLLPDVMVGRLPVETPEEAEIIVNKTLDYEKYCPATDFAKKMLLCGLNLTHAWNNSDAEDNSEYLYDNYIEGNWSGDCYRLYDQYDNPAVYGDLLVKDGNDPAEVTVEAIDGQMEIGRNFFHMATHGVPYGWKLEKYSESEAYDPYFAWNARVLSHPEKYTNVVTMSCHPFEFDERKYYSLGEGFLRSPEGGAVTFIGNAREGWCGLSNKIDERFYSYLFTEDTTGGSYGYCQQIGAVFSNLKESYSGNCVSSYQNPYDYKWNYYRFCEFTLTLGGDPELCLYTEDPINLNVSFPNSVDTGTPEDVTVSVTNGTNPVMDALVCISRKGTNDYWVGYTNSSGNCGFTDITFSEQGDYSVVVSSPNCYPFQGAIIAGETCVYRVPGDYSTIQAAINAASNHCVIVVYPGTYNENIDFNGKNVVLRSVDPTDSDIVAGTIVNGGENGSVVSFTGAEDDTCKLSGFTLTGGTGTLVNSDPVTRYGGGIYGNATMATITYNVIKDNTALGDVIDMNTWSRAGGIWNCDGLIKYNTIDNNQTLLCGGGLDSCDGLIEENIISNNSNPCFDGGGGLAYCDGTIRNNTITNNAGYNRGGALDECDGLIEGNLISQNQSDYGALFRCDGTIRGNIITGNQGFSAGGLFACNGTIEKNTISGNTSLESGGLRLCEGLIQNNIICFNTATAWDGGGLKQCHGDIINNTIYGNEADDDGGGLCDCDGLIVNCIVWGNMADTGSQLYGCSYPSYSCIQDWSGGTGNINLDPTLLDPANGDFHLMPNSPCVDAGALVSVPEDIDGDSRPFDGTSAPRGDGSDYDMGADELTVHRVDGNEFTTIQAAIDAAPAAGHWVIVVETGTYYENIDFKGKDICLSSVNPDDHACVSSTVIDGGNNGPVVTFSGTEGSSCFLLGFTIKNGSGLDGYGGGILGNGALATIIKNDIRDNTVSGGYGGGIAFCNGLIIENNILLNAAGVGAGCYRCDGTIESNDIYSNTAVQGGGIAFSDGTIKENNITENASTSGSGQIGGGGLFFCCGDILENSISDNTCSGYGGGLAYCMGGEISGNTIDGNEAVYGAGLYQCENILKNIITGNVASDTGGGLMYCSFAIHNNLICGNTATQNYGGGLAWCGGWGLTADVWNNTIYGNHAGDSAGGAYRCGGWLGGTVKNCILWGNTAGKANPQYSPHKTQYYDPMFYYCCIGGSISGIDPARMNFNDDPFLVDPASGDYHLSNISSCINSGCQLDAVTDDIEGTVRPQDGGFTHPGDGSGYDIGAYEFYKIKTVPGDFSTLQAAINGAPDSYAVVVSPATYYENLDFNGKNVCLRATESCDPAVVAGTVINGGQNGSVVTFDGTESIHSGVYGFTITNGNGTIVDPDPVTVYGGAVYGNGTSTSLRYNVITNNTANGEGIGGETWSLGGGIWNSDGLIWDNTITYNTTQLMGGGLCECDGTILRNDIDHNTASFGGGGGLAQCNGTIGYNDITYNLGDLAGGGLCDCDGTIQYNTISHNTSVVGGGLAWCDEGIIQYNTISYNDASDGGGLSHCDSLIRGNTICNNQAMSGGGLCDCDGNIQYNVIRHNSATDPSIVTNICGGGLHGCSGNIWSNMIHNNSAKDKGGGVYDCDGTLYNNTIYGNSAGNYGGGISGCGGAIKNGIFWGNTAPGNAQIYNSSQPTYSCIQDLDPVVGEGNINDNPVLNNPGGGNFHLTKDSPCLDAGAEISGLYYDFEGNGRGINNIPRIRGDGKDYDMGADELTWLINDEFCDEYGPYEAIVMSPGETIVGNFIENATDTNKVPIIKGVKDSWYVVYIPYDAVHLKVQFKDNGTTEHEGFVAIRNRIEVTNGTDYCSYMAKDITRENGVFEAECDLYRFTEIYINVGSEKVDANQELRITQFDKLQK